MASNWNNAVNLISLLPSSYLPGLMVEIVKVGYAKNMFQTGGASRLIQKVEAGLPPNTQMQIDKKPKNFSCKCGVLDIDLLPGQRCICGEVFCD